MAKPQKKISFDDENFTFELVLAERDYKGEPTGRMKPPFKTDDSNKMSAHYWRNRGTSKRKKKKTAPTNAQDAEKILKEINQKADEKVDKDAV